MTDEEMPQKHEEEIALRPNYFAGQYLLEDDFKLEQKYHIDRQRRHNRLLHVSGIAQGLTVTNHQDLTVKVSAGTAFDSQGRQIILLVEQNVDLEQDANNKNTIQDGDYTLSIRYHEELTPKQGTEEISNRWQEKPVFKLITQSTPDDISLAKLKIQGNNVTIDPSVRQYSGIYLPTVDGKGVTLRSSQGKENPNKAKLDGSLSISGTLEIHGQTQLNNALTVKGNTTIEQELKVKSIILGESGNGVPLRTEGGTNKNLAILEGSLRIRRKLEITEDCDMKANLKVEGGLITVHSLQIGLAPESKSVNRIGNKISLRDPDNETSIPTNAAVINFVEKRLPTIRKSYKKTTEGSGEFEVAWEGKSNNFVVPITLLYQERIKIKVPNFHKGCCTLMKVEEKYTKVTIKEEEDGWECLITPKEATESILSWTEEFERKFWNVERQAQEKCGIHGGSNKPREIMGKRLIERVTYEDQWKVTRRRSKIDVLIEVVRRKLKVEGNEQIMFHDVILHEKDQQNEQWYLIGAISTDIEKKNRHTFYLNEDETRKVYFHEEEEKLNKDIMTLKTPPVWKGMIIVSQ